VDLENYLNYYTDDKKNIEEINHNKLPSVDEELALFEIEQSKNEKTTDTTDVADLF
jgi:hypothetical protein